MTGALVTLGEGARRRRSGTQAHAFIADYPDATRCAHIMPDHSACGERAGRHRTRVEHRFIAETHAPGTETDVCLRCKKTRRDHLARKPRTTDRSSERRKIERAAAREKRHGRPLVFFDTEGKGNGKAHKLIYGAAVDDRGYLVMEVEARADSLGRITQPRPEVWLDALLEIARRAKTTSLFAYGFGYDRTMMLRGLPAEVLYLLTRREERPLSDASTTHERGGKGGTSRPRPKPLYWGDFTLDLQGSRFSVSKPRRGPDGRALLKDGKRIYDRVVVWDVIKFYQCGFCDALDQWRCTPKQNADSKLVVPDEELSRMREMKGKRHKFDKMPWEQVKAYCQSECVYGARLVRELGTACEAIGVELRRYDGAGSISDALMRNNEVQKHMMTANVICRWVRDSVKRHKLDRAIMGAFFGGRFENAYCGVMRQPVWEQDICSAYPYAMSALPCLACGRWEHIADPVRRRGGGIDKKIEEASLALVRTRAIGRDKGQAFGSLPHRDREGDIRFPIECETWCWRPEYLAARDAMKDRLEVREAFLYHTDCDHKPFKFMPALYLERLRVGKEGRGIAMKLGYNGCAGKTMQHVGSHRWQEYAWAGTTTSTTRAQLLRAIALFRDQWDVCYLATDSVFATSLVKLEEPTPTNTGEAAQRRAGVDERSLKPALGAWEGGEPFQGGMCFVRPGIAFPLSATESQLKKIKARGISKGVMLENVDRIVEHMSSQSLVADGPPGTGIDFLHRRVFGGMKMSVSKSGEGALARYRTAPPRYGKGVGNKQAIVGGYGCWYEQKISLRVGARPKRFARMPSEEGMLLPWPNMPYPSVAYGDAKKSLEALALAEAQELAMEQPDAGDADNFMDGAEL